MHAPAARLAHPQRIEAVPDQPCEAKLLPLIGRGGEEASTSAPSTADANPAQLCCSGLPFLPGYGFFWLTDFSLQAPTSSDWANNSAELTQS